MKKFLLFILITSAFFQSKAQRIKGSWQDYLSYSNATKVEAAGNKIYCVTEGGLFYYDRVDNSVNKISGLNGLSDFGIKTVAYGEEKEVLIVAYKNSNVDLIYDSEIVNLSDIKRKQLTGDKNINSITFYGNEAYLACGFGIVVLNLDRNEIKDTYLIGDGGTQLCVNDIEIFNGDIYAATESGIYKADINNPNLLDYQNWHRVENISHNSENFNHLVKFADKLIVNYAPGESIQDIMFQLDESMWIPYLSQIQFVNDIYVNDNFLVITGESEVYLVDNSHSIVGGLSSYDMGGQTISPINAQSALVLNDNSVWIADYFYGLVKIIGSNSESIHPSGPMDNNVFSLYMNGTDLWVAPGGRTESWANLWRIPHFQILRNGEWDKFSSLDYAEFSQFPDVVAIVADPNDADHIFVGSWGGGLIEFQNSELIKHYTNQNSPLETALPDEPLAPYVRIGGLDFDSKGNLWVVNSEVEKNLLKLTASGDWESFELPEAAYNLNVGQIVVTENDDKWIILPRGHDVYVVNSDGSEKIHLPVTTYFSNGTFEEFNRMNDVYSLVEDNEGEIWIGTSKGVAVYNNPSRIWDTENFYGIQPSLDLNNGLFNPLLETEKVTAIAVDGANRKWLGTSASGVYLVSETGEKEILHFTDNNSPLLSNTITSIAINQKSGEVFIGTDEGLISYQGDAVEGNDAYENVFVYPNPVRENYDGDIIVTGLIENTDVKITDISGNLVYNTQSLGGQAVWDGTNLNGRRVKTGVYLVFCVDETGEQTHISKLLFIN